MSRMSDSVNSVPDHEALNELLATADWFAAQGDAAAWSIAAPFFSVPQG